MGALFTRLVAHHEEVGLIADQVIQLLDISREYNERQVALRIAFAQVSERLEIEWGRVNQTAIENASNCSMSTRCSSVRKSSFTMRSRVARRSRIGRPIRCWRSTQSRSSPWSSRPASCVPRRLGPSPCAPSTLEEITEQLGADAADRYRAVRLEALRSGPIEFSAPVLYLSARKPS